MLRDLVVRGQRSNSGKAHWLVYTTMSVFSNNFITSASRADADINGWSTGTMAMLGSFLF